MGKHLPPSAKIEAYAHLASERIKAVKLSRASQSRRVPNPKAIEQNNKKQQQQQQQKMGENREEEVRVPLSEVVSDCVRRWFQDTLKEARNGDPSMQVLVGQMYQSGYGIAKNEQKARAWMTRASKYRSSVWKVSGKHPGYNASDSDSDEVKDDKN